jgi:hypothetical protein
LDDAGIIRVARSSARVDHDIRGGQVMLVVPKRFSYQSLDMVTPDRVSHDAGAYCQSQARLRTGTGACENGEQAIGRTFRVTVNAVEFGLVMETLRRSERPGECVQVRRRTVAGSKHGGAIQSAACDPWHDGGRAPCVRIAWPCARENRGYGHDVSCSAGKCASWLALDCCSRREKRAKTSTWWVKRRAARVRSKPWGVKLGAVK